MKSMSLVVALIVAAGLAAFWFASYNNTPAPIEKAQPAYQPLLPEPEPEPVKEDLTGKQLLVFAFDGSRDPKMWQDSLDFAQEMRAQNQPINFTYFISGVYLLTYKNRLTYQPPERPAGTSLIGFADSNADLVERINFINRALAEGHEIGSHANGHFNGAAWTAAQWQQEFDQFAQLVDHVQENNRLAPESPRLNISSAEIIGFRAPNLGRNPNLLQVLRQNGFRYDTSSTGKMGEAPLQQNELWMFPIAQIKYPPTDTNILSMDYNFYFKQTGARDLLKKDTPEWDQAFDVVYQAYDNYLANSRASNKAPVFIANHFSLWNDGLYWEVMKKFAADNCGRADVRCVSYRELYEYLNRP